MENAGVDLAVSSASAPRCDQQSHSSNLIAPGLLWLLALKVWPSSHIKFGIALREKASRATGFPAYFLGHGPS
jgi:hypothetical protein